MQPQGEVESHMSRQQQVTFQKLRSSMSRGQYFSFTCPLRDDRESLNADLQIQDAEARARETNRLKHSAYSADRSSHCLGLPGAVQGDPAPKNMPPWKTYAANLSCQETAKRKNCRGLNFPSASFMAWTLTPMAICNKAGLQHKLTCSDIAVIG